MGGIDPEKLYRATLNIVNRPRQRELRKIAERSRYIHKLIFHFYYFFILIFTIFYYVNDLAFSFNNILSDPFVLPNGTKLNSLFYADDLIILSRSKLGLQNCLNKLSSYCNSWMLKINPKKTKIMVFQKGTKKCDYVFHIGNEMIDIVQVYTYLGTRISSPGNFTLSIEDL